VIPFNLTDFVADDLSKELFSARQKESCGYCVSEKNRIGLFGGEGVY
jgi:hypothetical protein